MNLVKIAKTWWIAALVLFVLSSPRTALGQDGKITGRIVDAGTAEPVSSAQVFLEDQSAGTLSNIDGRYVLRNVPEGVHTVVVQMIGYGTKSITGVEVSGGGVTALDVALVTAAVALEGITVEARVETGSTTALLNERKASALMVDAIGSDQISRSPDGDAAAALKRVPGLSIVDGRFAYVRGLGERYSSTTLNGAPLASPMPDRKVVPLDVIPSGLLESIVTAKSYAPDRPGDYAGGLVQLRTKDFPASRILSVSVSGGFNSASTFQNGLRYAGGGLDFLGFDDGTRDLPDLLPADRRLIFPTFSRGQLEQFGEAFAGDWGPVSDALPPNWSVSASFGDEGTFLGRSVGVLASATYSNSFSVKEGVIERVFSSSGVADPEIDYRGDETVRSVSLGALTNLSYELSPTSRITANLVYNRLMDDEARVYEGFNLDSNSDQRNYRLRFLANTMANAQLQGQHQIGFLGDAKVDWRAAWSRASRYEPNTREVLYREENGDFLFENFVSSGSIFHQDLVDDTYSGGLDISVPVSTSGRRLGTVSFGGAFSAKDRDVFTRRFRYLMVPDGIIDQDVRRLSPNELFNPTTIASNGFELQEATFRPDNYDAAEDVTAAYAKLEAQLLPSVEVMAGVRMESTTQEVTPRDLFPSGLAAIPGANLDDVDWLPAVNLTFRLSEQINIRLGASQTLARPQLRELAPFAFADYAGGFLTVGNPELRRSLIRNFDARWEWFSSAGALIAASGFYKAFTNPIEVAVLPSSELLKTWVNGGDATNYGFELELRSDLGFITSALIALSVNANLTVVESEVTTPESIRVYIPGEGGTDLAVAPKTRAIQGQSPYVFNTGLTYASPGSPWLATVFFNRFGRRIHAVGGQATPDIFEEPRSQLDLVLERTLFNGTKVKLSASRLVGNEVTFTQGGGVLRQWDTGRTVSLSIGWTGG